MRFAVRMIAIAMFATACSQTATRTAISPTPQASPTPQEVGTATLTETACDFAMPDRIPATLLGFSLVARTKYTGHFGLIRIDDAHTYKELVDLWYGSGGQVAPSFSALVAEQAVPPNSSGRLVATITLKGAYAFHCGYTDESGKVTGFFHELRAG
jgi:hypothetical protein